MYALQVQPDMGWNIAVII